MKIENIKTKGTKKKLWSGRLLIFSFLAGLLLFPGCAKLKKKNKVDVSNRRSEADGYEGPLYPPSFVQLYYEKYFRQQAERWNLVKGNSRMEALDALPKDTYGMVNWTAAVIEGHIAPLAFLGFYGREEKPLKLNVFIEAKVPLMYNVLFPHLIHTYWLSCKNCHPNIFVAKAGANPITMDEIFQGKWCGRCHGRVAFPFWPKSNCNRCHIVPKGMSLQQEKF